ncbi:hypothetical protein AB0M41_41515 [Streptomyces sp. NPDC051896]|uniref:hypothetical protein n=1 Tax=Streptomyces sp. NPDC051896 TaxID=3155416 RepID=UPI0034253FC8
MTKISWTRRIVFAASSATLIGGGVALPATAMAAPMPQHVVAQAPTDDSNNSADASTGSNGDQTQVAGDGGTATANGGRSGDVKVDVKGRQDHSTINAVSGDANGGTANARGGDTNGDQTQVTGDAHGGHVKVDKAHIKAIVKGGK